MAKTSVDRWTHNETVLLLNTLEAFVLSNKLKGTCQDSEVYMLMVKELETLGVSKTKQQLINKIKYLKTTYKGIVDAQGKSGNGAAPSFLFYKHLDRIYGTRDIIRPPISCNVGIDPTEENSKNEAVIVKLEPSSDDQSEEEMFEESTVPPIQSPSTSCEKEDSCMDPTSSLMEELLRCPKRKAKKRKAEDSEDSLEVAITKLLNEPAPPPNDYLDLRTKALCCLIRARNLDIFDQLEVFKQCEELVINYKKKSS